MSSLSDPAEETGERFIGSANGGTDDLDPKACYVWTGFSQLVVDLAELIEGIDRDTRHPPRIASVLDRCVVGICRKLEEPVVERKGLSPCRTQGKRCLARQYFIGSVHNEESRANLECLTVRCDHAQIVL
jgi:hypothetical protein